jgi:hypothetical protein
MRLTKKQKQEIKAQKFKYIRVWRYRYLPKQSAGGEWMLCPFLKIK